jgi:hypothetical protein
MHVQLSAVHKVIHQLGIGPRTIFLHVRLSHMGSGIVEKHKNGSGLNSLTSLSLTIDDRNKFIRKIVDIRNDLSHGNVHPEDLDKDNDLFWQYGDLQLML